MHDVGAVLDRAAREGFTGEVYLRERGRVVVDRADGWADPRQARRVSRTTLFNIASVTKALTAIAILELVEAKQLELDAKLGRLVPDTPADKGEITIRQLLTHTGGLAHEYAANGERDRDAAVRKILAVPLAHPPGDKFGYSDDGYVLLAAIVERVTRTPFEQLVRRTILEPSGMHDTAFWDEVDDRVDPRAAQIVTLPLDDKVRGKNWGYIGAGGVWSTADDLARLFDTLHAGKLLAPADVDLVMSPAVAVSVGHAGYGWFVGTSATGAKLVFARGNEDWGHSALIYWYPEREILMTIVTSAGFVDETPFSRVVADRIEHVALP